MLQSCKPTPDTPGKKAESRRLEGNNVMKRLLLVAFFGALVPGAPTLHGTPRVAIHVSPVVAMEPALLTIRTTVEPSDENRKLNITIDSDAYTSSSDIPLEGRNAARLSVVEIRDVPSGLYEVRAVVSGSKGPIADSMQVVKIQPAVGRAH
jgi:hypothetical protein